MGSCGIESNGELHIPNEVLAILMMTSPLVMLCRALGSARFGQHGKINDRCSHRVYSLAHSSRISKTEYVTTLHQPIITENS